jgi:hypothetical protein
MKWLEHGVERADLASTEIAALPLGTTFINGET